jgi:hypothetical protein
MSEIPELDQALAAWRPGYALPGAVYQGEAIYREEMRRIFLKSWLYAGHVSQIPGRGDYFLFEMAGESGDHHARERRGRECAAERMPASRLAHLRRGQRPRSAAHLPLPRLDLRS